ncbi:hypothetical protein M3638_02940 [Oceanobacillus profundus]|uniref:hypothetical protein n=1 Tax=Oceanobacillus profundus TaxID=372463 RepID=UPI00203AE34A|nr:hypothetical protein [Oceanobacillus profundus]MCM3396795.1 hypothetical protein [Oceanobacillus profundus]
MNIETKLLVRYGIPGWYFILWLFILSKFSGVDIEKVSGLSSDILSSVVLTVLGVPIGYILYQIYFITTHAEHKNSTPNWNIFVFENIDREDRDYVSGRYSHMLRGVHEAGVLQMTFFLSAVSVFIIPAIIRINSSEFEKLSILVAFSFSMLNIVLALAVNKNYRFKQEELKQFIDGIKQSVKK